MEFDVSGIEGADYDSIQLTADDMAEFESLAHGGEPVASRSRGDELDFDDALSEHPAAVVRPAAAAASSSSRVNPSGVPAALAGSAAEYSVGSAPLLGSASAAAVATRTVTIALSPDAIALVHELAAQMSEIKQRALALNVRTLARGASIADDPISRTI